MSVGRPTTIQDMRARLALLRTPESHRLALAFAPRPDDVFISPYAKCGTTWMQQIVHGLRTGGSMAFDEITEVVPWIEMAHAMGVDPRAEQVARPRAFKSHLAWTEIPKGARYICILRDPAAALVSLYRFFEGWLFETGAISLEQFAREEFMARSGSRSYWSHLASWWPQRHRPDVLMLCYEHMVADLPAAVRSVAAFLDIDLDPELAHTVERQSSIEFMCAHGRQFDDHLVRAARDPVCGLPPGSATTKVRPRSATGPAERLGPSIQRDLDRIWQREITDRFGLADYPQMCDALRIPA